MSANIGGRSNKSLLSYVSITFEELSTIRFLFLSCVQSKILYVYSHLSNFFKRKYRLKINGKQEECKAVGDTKQCSNVNKNFLMLDVLNNSQPKNWLARDNYLRNRQVQLHQK